MGLSFAADTIPSLPLFVGLQADTRMRFANGMVWSPWARTSWVHEFEPTRDVAASFVTVPGAPFTVDRPRAAVDAARLELGSKLVVDERYALFGTLTEEFSDRSQGFAANGGVIVRW